MTKQVDFYLTTATNFVEALQFSVKLARKAYLQGNPIDVITDSEALTQSFDQLLWSAFPHDFIPHHLSHDNGCQLNISAPNTKTAPILLHLHMPSLDFVPSHTRLLQIIPNEEAFLTNARQLYRRYQQLGYKINSHKIG